MLTTLLFLSTADAAAPGLRVIGASSAPIGDDGTTVDFFSLVETSPMGHVATIVYTGYGTYELWRIVDGEATRVMAPGDPRPDGEGTFWQPDGMWFAGERLLFTDENHDVLWQQDPDGSIQRVVAVGESVAGVTLAVIAPADADDQGNVLLNTGYSTVLTNAAGDTYFAGTAGVELVEYAGWEFAGVLNLSDEGDFTSLVVDTNDEYAAVHGTPSAHGLLEFDSLMPNPYTDSSLGTVNCCVPLMASESGWLLATGVDNNSLANVSTYKWFRGLPGTLAEVLAVSNQGLALAGTDLKLYELPSPVYAEFGVGGGIGVVGELKPSVFSGERTAAMLFVDSGPHLVAKAGDVVGGFTIGQFRERPCAVTSSHVIFHATNANGDDGVFAYDRAAKTVEPWWLPGMEVEHPTLGPITLTSAQCIGDSRLYESGLASVIGTYELSPGGSHQWVLLDGGAAGAPDGDFVDLELTVDVAEDRSGHAYYEMTLFNSGTIEATAVEIDVSNNDPTGDPYEFDEDDELVGCLKLETTACRLTSPLAPDESVQLVWELQRGHPALDVVVSSAEPDAQTANNVVTLGESTDACNTGPSTPAFPLAALALSLARRRRR